MKNFKVEHQITSLGISEIKMEVTNFIQSIFTFLAANRSKIHQIKIRTNFRSKKKEYPVYRVILLSDLTQEHEFDLLMNKLFESFDKKNISLNSIDKVFITLYLISNPR